MVTKEQAERLEAEVLLGRSQKPAFTPESNPGDAAFEGKSLKVIVKVCFFTCLEPTSKFSRG